MPRISERTILTETLTTAYCVQLLTEGEEEVEAGYSSSSSEASSSDDEDESVDFPPLSTYLLQGLLSLYSTRYLRDRIIIPKRGQLTMLLTVYKNDRPDIFRSYTRVWPATFDALLDKIHHHSVFHPNNESEQIPIEEQLSITLFRFGHFGNAASINKVALWAGVGAGTVDLCTRRVMTALCADEFRRSVVRWPRPEEREVHKAWVEERSCAGWHDGWVMVDGTLVPLFAQPAFFGNTWYDRKSNYSMNVQLVSTPDLMIVDYSVGLPGSQHDATAWKETWISQDHETLLAGDEWVWADTAYPLQRWCQAPYKKPEKDIRENATHNYYVSRIRVRSEHCVGFLKGRWSSLRGLRIQISSEKQVQIAALWVICCITLHCFAMHHESGTDMTTDEFFQEGMRWLEQEQTQGLQDDGDRRRMGEEDHHEGKDFREELKGRLHRALFG